jgi:hypothetical protein
MQPFIFLKKARKWFYAYKLCLQKISSRWISKTNMPKKVAAPASAPMAPAPAAATIVNTTATLICKAFEDCQHRYLSSVFAGLS